MTVRSKLCPLCGYVGRHGMVHVRHGNGGGHNEPCPELVSELAREEAEREASVAEFAATLRPTSADRAAAARVLAESLFLLPAALHELGIDGKLSDSAHELARAVDRAADALEFAVRARSAGGTA